MVNNQEEERYIKEIKQLIEVMEDFINQKFPGINFKYPHDFIEYIPIIKSFEWDVPTGIYFLERSFETLERREGLTNLIPFAQSEEGNEWACFVIGTNDNSHVKVIWPFSRYGNEIVAEYSNIEKWISGWF